MRGPSGLTARRPLSFEAETMEPAPSERFDVGGLPERPAAPTDGGLGQPALADPAPDGLIVGPEFAAEPVDIPEFRGRPAEPERGRRVGAARVQGGPSRLR